MKKALVISVSLVSLIILTFQLNVNAQEDRSQETAPQLHLMYETQKQRERQPSRNVFVESDTNPIVGEYRATLRGARRSWEQKCDSWKKELKQDNGEALMIRHCGRPEPEEEEINEERLVRLVSESEYKIKVGCE